MFKYVGQGLKKLDISHYGFFAKPHKGVNEMKNQEFQKLFNLILIASVILLIVFDQLSPLNEQGFEVVKYGLLIALQLSLQGYRLKKKIPFEQSRFETVASIVLIVSSVIGLVRVGMK